MWYFIAVLGAPELHRAGHQAWTSSCVSKAGGGLPGNHGQSPPAYTEGDNLQDYLGSPAPLETRGTRGIHQSKLVLVRGM